MICKSAEQRLKVLIFWERHGLAATREVFAISRRTLPDRGDPPLQPGDCVAWDSIERRLHSIRRRLITRTDLASRFGFDPCIGPGIVRRYNEKPG
jgi:hypothetical protein